MASNTEPIMTFSPATHHDERNIMDPQVQQDLDFIKKAVERNRSEDLRSWSIWTVWAIIVLVGFSLVDFAPQTTGWFWMIAGTIGLFFTWVSHRRHEKVAGTKRGDGARTFLHWLAMGLAQILIFSLCDIKNEDKGIAAILFVALAYFYFGLYVARPFIWFAMILVAGAIAIRFTQGYAWTMLGALLASAFIFTAFVANRSRAKMKVA
jgi:hypothetical protein